MYRSHTRVNSAFQFMEIITLLISFNNSGLYLDTMNDTGEGTEKGVSDIKYSLLVFNQWTTSGPV